MKKETLEKKIRVLPVNEAHVEIYFDYGEVYAEYDISNIEEAVNTRGRGRIYLDTSLVKQGMLTVRGNITMFEPGDFTLEKAVEYIVDELAQDMDEYSYWES